MRAAALAFALSLICAAPAGAAEPQTEQKTEDHKIEGGDIAIFEVGYDLSSVGYVRYVVDRTVGLCFAHMSHTANGAGVVAVECRRLKKYPAIKAFIETGTRPE